MLVSLSIKNYALIKNVAVNFKEGYAVITGETGAGKSILLGALGLVLGNRAELNQLNDETGKCIIEAEFDLSTYNLQSVFESLDLDYELHTIIRRELLPNGKSRAFVNDSPVNIKDLQELQKYLIDIHSQHNNRGLIEKEYPYVVVDALANNQECLALYQQELKLLKKSQKDLHEYVQLMNAAKEQYDYNLYLYNELKAASVNDTDELQVLEAEIEKLSNIESIKLVLSEGISTCEDENLGVIAQIQKMSQSLQKIAGFDTQYEAMTHRMASVKIELDDLLVDFTNQFDKIEDDPAKLIKSNDRLNLLYDLMKKHVVTNLTDLKTKFLDLESKVANVEEAQHVLQNKEAAVATHQAKCIKLAGILSKNRKSVTDNFKVAMEVILKKLSMDAAQFKIEVISRGELNEFGFDEVSFLLSSNKGSDFQTIKKVASGGEISRIMLALKIILSKVISLPTIIFDEIDTGVSGEVASKIAELMKEMAQNMQVITISHLPQVAAKGDTHFKVYKQIEGETTTTYLRELSKEERVEEIAEMLSGKQKSTSALEHATQLLSF